MFNRRIDLIAATVVLTASMHSQMADVVPVNPEPWRKGTRHKGGSGTGQTKLDVASSRAKEKRARKARKIRRSSK